MCESSRWQVHVIAESTCLLLNFRDSRAGVYSGLPPVASVFPPLPSPRRGMSCSYDCFSFLLLLAALR